VVPKACAEKRLKKAHYGTIPYDGISDILAFCKLLNIKRKINL